MLKITTSLLVLLALLTGCSTIESRIAGRTATEQYLVSAAVERALNQIRWERFEGRKVFPNIVMMQNNGQEGPWITAQLKTQLNRQNAQLTPTPDQADVILDVMVKSVGTDIWASNFGIPLMLGTMSELPYNLAGLSIYSTNLQEGYCRLEFVGTDPITQETLLYIPPVYGNSYYKTTTFLGVFGPFKSSDIFPEKKLIRPKGYLPIPQEQQY